MQVLRPDTQQTVGLRHVAQDFRRHLDRRDADRHHQAGLLEHRAPERSRHFERRAEQASGPGQIEKSLVQRERFHDRAKALEHFAYRPRDFAITRHPAVHEDGLGTELMRLRRRHRGMHSELARLVRGRRDDAAPRASADDYRLSAQFGIVELLDRRVERVHIGMGDYAFPPVGRAGWRLLARAICPDCAHRTKLTTIAWPVILRALRAENPDSYSSDSPLICPM